jgi:glycosyltransferase involved in cell wall biosynthesis
VIIEKPEFSIIVPVFNRPDELRDLLESLSLQAFKDFEVIIVEDGSDIDSESVVSEYYSKLKLYYYKKTNSGPGLSRNFGAERAQASIYIFFDSDCVIPPEYLQSVYSFLKTTPVDSFGGPDRFHPSFTPIQKAIGYSMSSFLTTGGIRGGKTSVEKFHPRSFNMGFTKKVFEVTKGFSSIRFGEDIDLSIRIKEAGFSSALIPEAYVYHRRRTDFRKFFKQVYNSGIARINLYKRHPKSLKLFHFFPSGFVVYTLLSILLSLMFQSILFVVPLIVYSLAIFLSALIVQKSFELALLCLVASFVQLFGYGTGFISAFWKRIILGKGEFEAFRKNFYK